MPNWFTKLFRRNRRSLENPQNPLSMPWYGPPSLAGIYVSEQTALTYSAFWSAVRTISVDVASLKIQPMQHTDLGGCEPATDHWSYPLVHQSPDGLRPAIRFWASILQHGLTHGNGYAEIVRAPDGWRGKKLFLLPPEKVTPRYDGDRLYYEVQDETPRKVPSWNMIHCANPMSYDGVSGRSIVQTARESIGLGLGADLSMAAWYGNAARPAGKVTIPPTLDDQAVKNIREYVDEMHVGPMNNGRALIPPPGCDWQPIVLPAPDAEYLNSRIFQIQEIARWFSMPPTKLGDYSRSTFANLEQAEKSYWKTAVKPWADFLCGELNLKLFQPSERNQYFCKANYNELLVTDLAVKTAYYASGRQWGYLSVNDIRHDEGKNGIGEAGDVYLSPSNMVTDQQVLKQQDNPVAASLPMTPDPNVVGAARAVVTDALGRLVRRESAAVRRASTKPDFRSAIHKFYEAHSETMTQQLQPVIAAYVAASGRAIDLNKLVSDWIEKSQTALEGTSEVCLAEQLPDAIEEITETWNERTIL
jgi:HK97 family phage portal protein